MAYPYSYPQNFPTQSNGFPTQPNAYPTQMNVNPTQMSVNPAPQQPQYQSGGFMVIPSEDMVKNYPVAPGNCVTFKIEGKPIVMEKSMGFSQFESPKVDRYRLVKEEPEEIKEEEVKENDFDYEEIRTDIDKLWGAIDEIKSIIDKPTEKPTTSRRKKDDGD